jgi:hypothetical protein
VSEDIFEVDETEYLGPVSLGGYIAYVHQSCGALIAEILVEHHDAGCPEVTLLPNGQWVRHHKRRKCEQQWCWIHNPMPGPWEDWPQRWDNHAGMVARTCEHGVEHPDPAQFDYWRSQGLDYLEQHVCCSEGCVCAPPRDATAVLAMDATAVSDAVLNANGGRSADAIEIPVIAGEVDDEHDTGGAARAGVPDGD